MQRGIPQGLKPVVATMLERPKAEALGYLNAGGRCLVGYAFGMRVKVLYFGVLKDGFGREGEWLEVAEGASVADVVAACRGRFGGAPWESVAVAVNREYARVDATLKEGDEVALLPPVSGGLMDVGLDVGRGIPQGLKPFFLCSTRGPSLKAWRTWKQIQGEDRDEG